MKDYKIIRKTKIRGKKKKILGDFHCTKEKMERDCGNKMQTLQNCFNYGLPKVIVDNGLEDL